MFKRLVPLLAALAFAAPALATPQPQQSIELTRMAGRWYEVARVPNKVQNGCEAGASEWRREGEGFQVLQTCRKGGPDGPVSEWKATAKVADPKTNAKFKMSFFGGLVQKEYWVLDHSADWLILSTADGKYLWLMSQKPVLPGAARGQALTRIRQLGFDASRLEFPPPGRS